MTYCPVCIQMECKYKGKLMPSKWDDDSNKEEPKDTLKIVTATLTPSPQQNKPYK